jgi:ribosomal protein S18 acetylase RimI-like enzyme
VESARTATIDDLDAVVTLARGAVAELAELRGGEVWRGHTARREPLGERLARELARDASEGEAVVALVDDAVLGYAVSHLETLGDGSVLAVVDDLYVAPGARGIGLGEAMMDLLVEHARGAGARGIDALALPGDRATKNFFESFGLKARAIVVHRDLRSDGAAPA